MLRTDLEKLYDHKTNPVPEGGDDLKAVVAWLVKQGSPQPAISIQGQLGSGYEPIHLFVFTGDTKNITADGPGLALEVNDVCNDPGMALVLLQQTFGFGSRDKMGHTVYTPYPVAVHPPAPPPPPAIAAATPVGFPLQADWGVYYTCSLDSKGIAYQPKNGETYNDARGTFTAYRYATPMGYGAYWYLKGFVLGMGDTLAPV